MYSHSLKPVKQLSSQTMQDTASQFYKTYWNYFQSSRDNNMLGEDLRGGGGSLVLPTVFGTGLAAPVQHPIPHPIASNLPVYAALCTNACFGSG